MLLCITDRLVWVAETLNVNKPKKFQEVTGFAYRTAQSYLDGSRKPGAEALLEICTRLRVNLNWLVAGIGDPFLNDASLPPKQTVPKDKNSFEEQELLDCYRQAVDDDKKMILQVARRAEKKAQENIEIPKTA